MRQHDDHEFSSHASEIDTNLEAMDAAGKEVADFLSTGYKEIAERRTVLERKKSRMLAESLGLQKDDKTNKQDDVETVISSPPVVKLNIGGKHLDVRRSTITQVRSRLAWILSGRWDHVLPKDKDGRLFFDLDPEWFEPIINHLRDLGLQDPSKPIPGPTITLEHQFAFHYLVQYIGLESTYE